MSAVRGLASYFLGVTVGIWETVGVLAITAAIIGPAPLPQTAEGPCLEVRIVPHLFGRSTGVGYADSDNGSVWVKASEWPKRLQGQFNTTSLLQYMAAYTPDARVILLHEAVWHLLRGNYFHTPSGLGAAFPLEEKIPRAVLAEADAELIANHASVCAGAA